MHSLTRHLSSTSSSQHLLLRPNWGCFGVGPSIRQSQEHRWIWKSCSSSAWSMDLLCRQVWKQCPRQWCLVHLPLQPSGRCYRGWAPRVGNSCKLMKTRVFIRKNCFCQEQAVNYAAPLSKKKRPTAHEYQHQAHPKPLQHTWCHKQHTGGGDKDLGEAGDINVLRTQRMEISRTPFFFF